MRIAKPGHFELCALIAYRGVTAGGELRAVSSRGYRRRNSPTEIRSPPTILRRSGRVEAHRDLIGARSKSRRGFVIHPSLGAALRR
jgi:hypothetical protein